MLGPRIAKFLKSGGCRRYISQGERTMAGEMTTEEVTKENFPIHFAVAKSLGGGVRPFDQYQGPFVYVPGFGKFWLCMVDSHFARWYSDYTGKVSEIFYAFADTNHTACRRARQCLPDSYGYALKGGTVP